MFKFSFKQQVLTGFAVSLTFVLASAITSFLSVKSVENDDSLKNHSYEVINHTRMISLHLTRAESGMRGFILTGRPSYLVPYSANAKMVMPNIRELRNLISDNPLLINRVDSMTYYVQKKLTVMDKTLVANSSGKIRAALGVILTDSGKLYMDNIERISRQIVREEKKLLAERTITAKKSSDRTIVIVLGSAVIIFCLFLILLSYIKRTFEEQKRKEKLIRTNNIRLAHLSAENEQKHRLLSGLAAINEVLRGDKEIEELSTQVVSEICNFIKAPVGLFFLADEKHQLLLQSGSYAYQQQNLNFKGYHFGEGLVGQAALDKQRKLLTVDHEKDIKINTGLVSTPPPYVYLFPLLFEERTVAVIELGLTAAPDKAAILYLETVEESIAIGINSARARIKLRNLFEQTQQQAAELENNQEEMRTTNEELMFKTHQLQASEEELRVQQEELKQINTELEEKAEQLEERNYSINQANEAINLKAEELIISNKYKSEFLANMSHELRTPLNSILILARILKDNKPENLNDDQVKYAGVIHSAGNDLLTLINDILDLSKIESGKVDLKIESVSPDEIKNDMEALFSEIAKNKKVEFVVRLAHDLPERLVTDLSRLEQIIKNLLSNAFKFTPPNGKITLELSRAADTGDYHADQLKKTQAVVALKVKDSGIGIAEEKQKLIFEAFQQADGSTNRKYGGTGLGLSISKELAHILGGEIHLESLPNAGSTFTLYIPAVYVTAGVNVQEPLPEIRIKKPIPTEKKNGRVLLIVEDDEIFASVLKDYAIEKGFEPLLAHQGDTGLEMAINKLPDAIILDIMLPVMDGWSILKKLKANPKTAHIPVHMMSAGEQRTAIAQQAGAISFLKKPIEVEQLDETFNSILAGGSIKYNFKTVLLIEDQELQSELVKEELVKKGIEVAQAFSGAQAMDLLERETFDCIILDLKLPDISGFDLLDKIKTQPALVNIPVVINTAMELDEKKIAHIMKYSEAMVLKSKKSNNRLIDEVSLFMNKLKKTDNNNPPLTLEKAFQGKTILITDDDMRNIFALSSALEDYNLNILVANNGKEALEKLNSIANIDLVLMDIMMPEMDGYEAMRNIRLKEEFTKLPIIALTSKAMKQDREKCIEAGANDYIAKPVDIEKLLSMMRVWLS